MALEPSGVLIAPDDCLGWGKKFDQSSPRILIRCVMRDQELVECLGAAFVNHAAAESHHRDWTVAENTAPSYHLRRQREFDFLRNFWIFGVSPRRWQDDCRGDRNAHPKNKGAAYRPHHRRYSWIDSR